MGIETTTAGNVTTTTVTAPVVQTVPSGAEETVMMSFSEIRRAINGEMDFTVKINKDVEIAFTELGQTELNIIDNELDRRGIVKFKKFTEEETKKIESGEINTDYISKDYQNTLKVLKLAWAYKSMTSNGKKVNLLDENKNIVTTPDQIKIYVEKLLWGLGEGPINGLYIQYENIVAQKFLEVQKKT